RGGVGLTIGGQAINAGASVESRSLGTFLSPEEFDLSGTIQSGPSALHVWQDSAVSGDAQDHVRHGADHLWKSVHEGPNALARRNVREKKDGGSKLIGTQVFIGIPSGPR